MVFLDAEAARLAREALDNLEEDSEWEMDEDLYTQQVREIMAMQMLEEGKLPTLIQAAEACDLKRETLGHRMVSKSLSGWLPSGVANKQ